MPGGAPQEGLNSGDMTGISLGTRSRINLTCLPSRREYGKKNVECRLQNIERRSKNSQFDIHNSIFDIHLFVRIRVMSPKFRIVSPEKFGNSASVHPCYNGRARLHFLRNYPDNSVWCPQNSQNSEFEMIPRISRHARKVRLPSFHHRFKLVDHLIVRNTHFSDIF